MTVSNADEDLASYHAYCFSETAESLPANFAVWAATNKARFLHGRFVTATWDVKELKGALERDGLVRSPSFLKIGVKKAERS
jgi:hypothetical protein